MTSRCPPFSGLYSDGSLMLPQYANPSSNGATPSVLVKPGTSVSVLMSIDLINGSPDVHTPTTQMEQNVWVHWLVSVERLSTTVSNIWLYKNGAPVPTATTQFNPNQVLVNSNSANVLLTIGAGATSSTVRNNYFAGFIDEVQLYSGQFFSAVDAKLAYGNIFTTTANRVYWAHFMTPDFLAVQTADTYPDAAGKQGVTTLRPTFSAATSPGPILWANNYTNPLCLPRPSGLALLGSTCAAVLSTFTFQVAVVDWTGATVTSFTGGSVKMSYPSTGPVPLVGTTWVNSASGTFSGLVATSSFVNGLATFAIYSPGIQTITVSSNDYLPIFSGAVAAQTGPAAVQTLAIGFAVGRAFTFQSVTSGVTGSSVTVTVALTSCGSQIITGVSTSVTVVATGSATPSSSVLVIDPATGMGTVSFTRFTAGSAALTLTDSASTSNDVSSTMSASWTSAATTFGATMTNMPAAQTVLGAYTFNVFTADAAKTIAAFNGTCILQVSAVGTGSYKNPLSQIYLNKQPLTALNFTFTPLVTSYSLSVLSALVQTVTLSYTSFCSNLTVTPSQMTPNVVSFTNGPRITYSISTPYPMLSASMGSTVPFVVYALDLYGNIDPSITGVDIVISSFNVNGVGTCTTFSFSGMGPTETGTATTTTSKATVRCTNGVCKVNIKNPNWGVCRWTVNGWPGTYATCLWYDPATQDPCPAGTMVSSHWAPGYYKGGQAIFSNTGDVINLAGQSWTLFTYMSPIYSVTGGLGYIFAIGTTIGVADALCITVNSNNCLQMAWGTELLAVCPPIFRYSYRDWTAVAFQYDAVTKVMSIWQQGFLIAAQKASPMMATGPVTIGNCPHLNAITTGGASGTQTKYQIQLDETYLYQRVLSPSEIYSAAIYNNMPSSTGLVVWLSYDDNNSSPSLRDTSGHGFDFLVQYDSNILVMTHYGVCLPVASTLSFLNLPAVTRAATSFSVTVQVLDPAGLTTNTFTSTSYAGWVNVSCSGSAVCPPAIFFQQSTANFSIYDAVPESVTVSLVDNFPTGLIVPPSTTLEFIAGPVASVVFDTTPAASQQPRQWATVLLDAVDSLGVIKTDENREIGIAISPTSGVEMVPASRV